MAERALLVAASSHSSCSNFDRHRAASSNSAFAGGGLHRCDDLIDGLERSSLQERYRGIDSAAVLPLRYEAGTWSGAEPELVSHAAGLPWLGE